MKLLKRILLGSLIVCVIIGVIHIISMFTLDQMIEYKRVSIVLEEHHDSTLDGFKIAFITDVHDYPDSKLEEVVEYLNEQDLDLLVLGGDFLETNYQASIEILSKVTTKCGIVGVAGNHDSATALKKIMEEKGMIFLSNQGFEVKAGFYIGGVADLWKGKPNISDAIADAQENDFILLLAHNPDTVMYQSTERIDLTLSGHTHGGEVTFFGILQPGLWFSRITKFGQRFGGGFATSRDGTTVYVSRGVGKQFLRVFARPEITIITLKK